MQEDNSLKSQLELIGITPETYNALPDDFKQKLEAGELTPMICVSKTMPNGNVVEMPVKLKVDFDKNGKQNLTVYPFLAETKNEMNLSESAYANLMKGDVLHVDDHYYQRDPETNCILKVSDKEMDIKERMKDVEKIRDIELGREQKERIRRGLPVELNVGGEMVTLGVDLKEPHYFKTLKGDMNEWEYQQKVNYDILHPEFLGVVKTDENRWEYQQVVMHEKFPQKELNEKPQQTKSAGMRMS